jgi:hypothetical protein
LTKCRCDDPEWRMMARRRKRSGDYKYRLVCLTCEWKWWTAGKYAEDLPMLTLDEEDGLDNPYVFLPLKG